MKTMRLTILTPTRTLYFDDGDLITLTTNQGSEGFMFNHIPTIVEVEPGPLRYRTPAKPGKEESWRVYFISIGYAEIQGDYVTVVTGAAESADEIDVDRAKRALLRAEARLAKEDATEAEMVQARRGIKRAEARLAFVRRYGRKEEAS